MTIKTKPEGATNVVEFEIIGGKTIDFEDGELSFNVKKREQDDDVTIYICRDFLGGLVMGTAAGDKYVAELFIPARQYVEEGEGEDQQLVPVPFDIDRCIERVRRLNPDIKIYPVSAKTGEGMEAWENWLRREIAAWKA